MAVLLVTPAFWPEVRRGAERFAHDLARALGGSIVTTHPGPPRRAVEDGVPVRLVPRLPGERRARRRAYEEYLTAIAPLALALRRSGAQAAIATHPTAAVAAQRAGLPTVFAYMGIPHRQALANRRARVALVQRACRDGLAVTALSQAAADGFERWLGIEAQVIRPGVDLDAFAPGGERDPRPTIVCPSAAAEPRKRVGLLVEAFALVRARRPDARLVLDRGAAALAPLPDGVALSDLDDRAALADAYRRAWVCALPSWGEAFGLVLAEALACGTPVVGADREGIPEVIGDDPRVGRLFAGEDPRGLATALLEAIELAGDPPTAAACRARAGRFGLDRCAAAYAKLLHDRAGIRP
ncbi:MAG TPA: glycosyltransferase family 4 protein [Solirubrobacteraceae bacterium]|nr:glycosyltransferase family 4 protein [Solirubrobacteraceae bacterium]